jgi:hypothetical protein
MPDSSTHVNFSRTEEKQFLLSSILYCQIRPHADLNQQSIDALKGYSNNTEYFTRITLRDARQPGMMLIEFLVTALSPAGAERAGFVYLGQLCDVLSAVTRETVRFLMPSDDDREVRARSNKATTHIDRILKREEWDWIIGNLVSLRERHPRFLAASSWYRKGLCGLDPLERTCCFWRVIERLALSYHDENVLFKEDKGKVRACVRQFANDFQLGNVANSLLLNDNELRRIIKLRNDISHGNEPITPQLIESASELTKPLEEAAFESLNAVKRSIDCLTL